jgi:hypothetical protein
VRPAYPAPRSDRDCPLDTVHDRCLWHVGGTAGEDGDGSYLVATVAVDDRVRPVPLVRCPLTTSEVGSAGRTLCYSQVSEFYISWERRAVDVSISNELHGMAYS